MLSRLRQRVAREQGGFTLIELLIAAGLCMVGLIAVMTVFDGSRALVTEAERNEAASHRAQRALEDAVSRPWDDIALQGTTAPAQSTDPNHPNNRVRSGGTYLFRTGQAPAPFVMGGALVQQEPWQDAADPRLQGRIYRYVTTYQDGAAVTGRRVIVAVTVDGRRKPVTLSTIVRETP